ncbi:MAG: DUF6064 family protein [Candidatus Bathyarchaeia archaeon]
MVSPLDIFESYNNAIFPMQFVTLIVAALLVYLLHARPSAKTSGLMKAYLAFTYAWIVVVYNVLSTPRGLAVELPLILVVENIAVFIANIAIAILFAMDVFTKKTELKLPEAGWRRNLTLLLVVWAFFLYPLSGWVIGHPYPRIPLFGVYEDLALLTTAMYGSIIQIKYRARSGEVPPI